MLDIYIKKLSTFQNIKNKKKIIEGRLYRGIFKKIKCNDIINFCLNNEKIKVKILELKIFENFKEMLIEEGICNILPDIIDINEGVNIYNEYYSKINKNVLSIKFSILE